MHGGASFGGLGCFSLGENGGKFVMGTTLNWVHQFHCERKKKVCQNLILILQILNELAGIHLLYCFYFSPFTRLLRTLQLPTGCCLFSSRWGRIGLALLLASKARRGKGQPFPSQVHEPSWGPCMRHGKSSEVKGALHLRACRCAAAEKRTPLQRGTCISCVP